MIKIRDIQKSFGSLDVLRGISLTFEPGKVYGIVGSNGSGKTTLFRCIAGLESCQGKIESDLGPLKNHLGFLETEPYFFNRITGKEYLHLLVRARGEKVEEVEEKNIFDLPLGRYASKYSTGMKKKLALLGILLQKNEYFILDEPFNGVDIQSNMLINQIIDKLREKGKTVILSSHIFETLRSSCDVIHQLDNGKIRRTVTKEDFDSLEKELAALAQSDQIDKLPI